MSNSEKIECGCFMMCRRAYIVVHSKNWLYLLNINADWCMIPKRK